LSQITRRLRELEFSNYHKAVSSSFQFRLMKTKKIAQSGVPRLGLILPAVQHFAGVRQALLREFHFMHE
jgi:hypothetical protein